MIDCQFLSDLHSGSFKGYRRVAMFAIRILLSISNKKIEFLLLVIIP